MHQADIERQFRRLDSPRRRQALASIGKMRGFQRPRWQTGLRISIDGDIDVADSRGRIVHSQAIEATVACNPHVDDITVVIESGGGDMRGALAIFRALQRHPASVTTIARGYCASAATIILMAGTWREAAPGARLLMHSVAIKPNDSRWTSKTHAWAAQECEATDAWLARFYAERTHGKVELWQREMKSEGYMSVDRALALGVVYCVEGEAIVHRGRRYAWPAA